MPAAVSELIARSTFAPAERPANLSLDRPWSAPAAADAPLLSRILTTSLVLHLLLVGILGVGLPPVRTRARRPAVPPPTKAELIDRVTLQEEVLPPEPVQTTVPSLPVLAPEPPAAAAIDLPSLSQVEPISAVPASVPVAFGLDVKGHVRLVSDAAHASGAVGGRALKQPVSIDGNAAEEKNLLLPEVAYPPGALSRRQQGTVVLEFRTSERGEISDVKVRTSSGFSALDRAALDNLVRGRWTGAAGYYLKAYDFRLN